MPTLNWIGKEAVVNHHQHVPFHLLKDVPDLACGDPGSGNLIVQGDNLVALKALLPHYAGQVKCIYIDPPYNTGNEGWAYNDNVNSPIIRKWLGEVVGKEGETLDRHDRWLCMMYPRLVLLREFLRNDGAIFVSLDYHEQPYLRLLLDGIYGAPNFVSEIACVNKPSGRSDDKYIATAHESITVYRKGSALKLSGFEPEDKIVKRYSRVDANGERYREEDLRKRGDQDERKDRPNLFYPFFYAERTGDLIVGNNEDATPAGYIRIEPMKTAKVQGRWRWERDTAIESKRYLHPRYMPNKGQWSVFEWEYLKERGLVKPTTVWDFKDVNSERGTEAFTKMLGFPKEAFPNPKPVGTIERILQIATQPGDLILDSFAGSGTTGHAVLKMNATVAAAHGLPLLPLREERAGERRANTDTETAPLPSPLPAPASQGEGAGSEMIRGAGETPTPRRFILVEMEPKIASDITAERVKRVAQGYTNAKGEQVAGLGGGFRFCELGEPLFDEVGKIRESVRFADLARHVYFTETGEPLPRERVGKSPLLGVTSTSVAVYLLYNGILKDKSVDGGNVLTSATLALLPSHAGPRVVYAAGCRFSPERLKRENIFFKQTPYAIRLQ